MKTNRCVWPADSAACTGSELANLQHVHSSQWGPSTGASSDMQPDKQTEEEEEEEKKKPRLQSKLQLEAIEVVHLSKAVLSWCWSPYFYWWSVVFTDTFGAHNCEFWWLCFVADFHVIHEEPKPLRLCSILRWSRPLRFKHKRSNLKDWLSIFFVCLCD